MSKYKYKKSPPLKKKPSIKMTAEQRMEFVLKEHGVRGFIAYYGNNLSILKIRTFLGITHDEVMAVYDDLFDKKELVKVKKEVEVSIKSKQLEVSA